MTLSRKDIGDLEIIDAEELLSDGTVEYHSDDVTSVVSGVVTVSNDDLRNPDIAPEVDDIFVLTGATAGNGTYTINTVTGAYTFTVNEAIPDSTGGSASFRHPSGALKVGVDPSQLYNSTQTNLQGVIEDIDAVAGGTADLGKYIITTEGGIVYTNDGDLVLKVAA